MPNHKTKLKQGSSLDSLPHASETAILRNSWYGDSLVGASTRYCFPAPPPFSCSSINLLRDLKEQSSKTSLTEPLRRRRENTLSAIVGLLLRYPVSFYSLQPCVASAVKMAAFVGKLVARKIFKEKVSNNQGTEVSQASPLSVPAITDQVQGSLL